MTQRAPKVCARTRAVALVTAAAVYAVAGVAVVMGQAGATLSDADRAEIQQLSERYVRALNGCAAEEYADLFAPDGVFESTFRGRVQGRQELMALVRSERHCAPGAAPRAAGTAPAMAIRPSAGGAVGTATLPNNAGGVEEHYVKTAQGWRLRSRTVFTAKELASKTGPGRSN